MGIFPTGYGKSLTFQILPAVCKQLEKFSNLNSPTVVVVSPLLSLIDNQVASSTGKFGLLPTALNDNLYSDIAQGKFNLIFGTPESWLSKRWRDMLSSSFFNKNVVCLVVDEVHLVTWLVIFFIVFLFM